MILLCKSPGLASIENRIKAAGSEAVPKVLPRLFGRSEYNTVNMKLPTILVVSFRTKGFRRIVFFQKCNLTNTLGRRDVSIFVLFPGFGNSSESRWCRWLSECHNRQYRALQSSVEYELGYGYGEHATASI